MQDGQVKYAEGGTEKQRREGERGSGAVEDEWKMRKMEREIARGNVRGWSPFSLVLMLVVLLLVCFH